MTLLSLCLVWLLVAGAARAQTSSPSPALTVPPAGTYTIKTPIHHAQVGVRSGDEVGPAGIRLTPCAQAILGCCAPEVTNRQHCFEQLGCGPHVFGDPCHRDFMNQALGGAERFYQQFMPNTVDGTNNK